MRGAYRACRATCLAPCQLFLRTDATSGLGIIFLSSLYVAGLAAPHFFRGR